MPGEKSTWQQYTRNRQHSPYQHVQAVTNKVPLTWDGRDHLPHLQSICRFKTNNTHHLAVTTCHEQTESSISPNEISVNPRRPSAGSWVKHWTPSIASSPDASCPPCSIRAYHPPYNDCMPVQRFLETHWHISLRKAKRLLGTHMSNEPETILHVCYAMCLSVREDLQRACRCRRREA